MNEILSMKTNNSCPKIRNFIFKNMYLTKKCLEKNIPL